MTPEAQRIAIAKACGLMVIKDPAGTRESPDAWKTGFFTPTAAKNRRLRWPSSAVVKVIPDYLNDLNACHEMAGTISGKNLRWYRNHLNEIAGSEAIDATAAQRCEAFLRTLNLWVS